MACPWSAPSHYLNQCWNIVNSKFRNKFQLNINRNFYIFSFKKLSSGNLQPFCLAHNVLSFRRWSVKYLTMFWRHWDLGHHWKCQCYRMTHVISPRGLLQLNFLLRHVISNRDIDVNGDIFSLLGWITITCYICVMQNYIKYKYVLICVHKSQYTKV